MPNFGHSLPATIKAVPERSTPSRHQNYHASCLLEVGCYTTVKPRRLQERRERALKRLGRNRHHQQRRSMLQAQSGIRTEAGSEEGVETCAMNTTGLAKRTAAPSHIFPLAMCNTVYLASCAVPTVHDVKHRLVEMRNAQKVPQTLVGTG